MFALHLYIAWAILFLIKNAETVAGQKPSNDRCIDSITLEPNVTVNGDNSNANYDYHNQGVCGARSDRRALWYEINGAGYEVTGASSIKAISFDLFKYFEFF